MGVIYDAEAYIAATVNHLSLTWGGHKQEGGGVFSSMEAVWRRSEFISQRNGQPLETVSW